MPLLSTLAAGVLAAAASQAGAPPDPVAEALRRFDLLPAGEQALVAAEMRETVLGSPHPLIQAVQAASLHPRVREAQTLAWDPERAFDADLYAPALELRTRVLAAKDGAWRKVVRTFLGGEEPAPPRRWRWDAGRNALLAPPEALPPREVVEALLRGRWPADGLETAYVAGALDGRDALDARADYFAHHYRDRSGRVYRAVTLYDVWGSGLELEISDVEAVAWLRRVEGRDDLRSPIPGRYHTPIYELIKRGYATVREEKVLREGLAARLADPGAPLPATLQGVTRLVDGGLVALRHDPAALEALLVEAGGRAATLAALAARSDADGGDGAAAQERARHRAARASFPQALAAAAVDAAREAGLLGFGRR